MIRGLFYPWSSTRRSSLKFSWPLFRRIVADDLPGCTFLLHHICFFFYFAILFSLDDRWNSNAARKSPFLGKVSKQLKRFACLSGAFSTIWKRRTFVASSESLSFSCGLYLNNTILINQKRLFYQNEVELSNPYGLITSSAVKMGRVGSGEFS